MHSLRLATHIVNAVYIIRTNTIILWFLGIIGLTSSINSLYPETGIYKILVVVYVSLSIIATPVIYGIYYEIIEDTYSSIKEIAQKYVFQYIKLVLKLYFPVVFFASLPIIMNSSASISPGHFQMVIVSCSLMFIYIVPTFYVDGYQQDTIHQGLSFLFNHLSASTPLILLTLLADSMVLLFEFKKVYLLLHLNNLVYILADFFVYMVANVLDFVLFITIIFVLKEAREKINHNDIN